MNGQCVKYSALKDPILWCPFYDAFDDILLFYRWKIKLQNYILPNVLKAYTADMIDVLFTMYIVGL